MTARMDLAVPPPPPNVTPIFVQLTHCHDLDESGDCVLLEAFELRTDVRWTLLHNSYADAYGHADRLGLANERMRDFRMSPTDPYFSYEVGVFRPGETFREFFQTKAGLHQ